MEVRLDGRTAIITGSSKGLGLAMAKEFATSGANVAILARSPDTLAEARDIALAGVTVRRDPRAPGEAAFVAPDPSVLKPGDLVFATSPGFCPEQYGGVRRSHGVCGVVKSIVGDIVRMASVVKGLGEGGAG